MRDQSTLKSILLDFQSGKSDLGSTPLRWSTPSPKPYFYRMRFIILIQIGKISSWYPMLGKIPSKCEIVLITMFCEHSNIPLYIYHLETQEPFTRDCGFERAEVSYCHNNFQKSGVNSALCKTRKQGYCHANYEILSSLYYESQDVA